MSIDTKKRKNKEKKNKKKQHDEIPSEKIPKPLQKKQPPKPITLKESNKGISRPTRLPPRFRSQLTSSSITTRSTETLSEQENKLEENSIIKKNIVSPVSIKKTREPIPAPEDIKHIYKTPVKPTRIEIEEEPVIVNKKGIRSSNYTKNQSSGVFASQELILKQFDVSEILNRPDEKGWPWINTKTIKIPQELGLFWRAEASLYSAIASLHFLTNANERGEIAPEVYGRQLKSHLMEAIQLRFKLEKDKMFTWNEFVVENKIQEFFPEGLEKLDRVTGSSDIDEAIEDETVKLDFQEIKKLPTKAADFVGNSIELMDIIRLQSIATVERLIPLLEDLRKILLSAKMFGEDYWIIKEVDSWTKRLYSKEPGTIPEDEELERLEMHVVRWLNDFRRELKNL